VRKSDILNKLEDLSLFVACFENRIKDMHVELIGIKEQLSIIIDKIEARNEG
jgi:hypothetical protein